MDTKTVLITGASGGVGEATARLFAARGWNVVASARVVERIGGWADQPNVARLAMDVTDEAAVQAAVASAAAASAGSTLWSTMRARASPEPSSRSAKPTSMRCST